MITCSTNNQEKGDSIPGFILALRSIFRKIYISSLRPATLLKKGFWHRCFPVNFAKIFRTPFLYYLRQLLKGFFKKLFLKILQNSQENTFTRKLQLSVYNLHLLVEAIYFLCISPCLKKNSSQENVFTYHYIHS